MIKIKDNFPLNCNLKYVQREGVDLNGHHAKNFVAKEVNSVKSLQDLINYEIENYGAEALIQDHRSIEQNVALLSNWYGIHPMHKEMLTHALPKAIKLYKINKLVKS